MTQAEVGSEFGHYRIEQFIGRGGMGVVYRAEHVHLGRKVAIKLLAPELAANDSFRERFVRESRLAASIDHPNVIPIYEAADLGGTYFIAMRYVEGIDLKEVIQTAGRLDAERALAILSQIAGALDAAHARGLVHRDVKPGNILVASDSGHCYLTDFGLTKAASSTTGFTATGQFVGTTDYCAPEQIEGKPLDRRTDVYSLACVFFECLAGVPPFRRDSDMATMWAHIQEPPPPITAMRPDLPATLDAVIATAMAKSKDDRYPTCSAFAGAAISALEAGTGRAFSIAAPAPPPPTPVPPPTPAPPPAPAQPSPYAQPELAAQVLPAYPYPPGPYDSNPTQVQRRSPVTAIALIVAALLLAGGGTVAALIVSKQKDDSGSASSTVASGADTGAPPVSSTSTQTVTETTTTKVPSQPEPPSGTVTPPVTPKASSAPAKVKGRIEGYWSAIENHDWGTALAYWAPGHAPAAGPWTRAHIRDGVESVTADFTPGSVSGSTATTSVNTLTTTSDRCGTQHWTGSFTMIRVNGVWKIADSKLATSEKC